MAFNEFMLIQQDLPSKQKLQYKLLFFLLEEGSSTGIPFLRNLICLHLQFLIFHPYTKPTNYGLDTQHKGQKLVPFGKLSTLWKEFAPFELDQFYFH